MSSAVDLSKIDIAKDREENWKNRPDNYHLTNTSQAIYRREFIAKMMKANNPSSILELGCNSGGNLLYIGKSLPKTKLVGIDINDRAIEHGKKVEKNPADLRVGSIYDLSGFKDKSFDMVFTCTVLIHIPPEKIPNILKEASRIAKYFVVNIEHHGKDEKPFMFGGGVPHRWVTDYEKAYAQIGFQQINVVEILALLNQTSGGAEHLMWVNLADKHFRLPV